MTHFKIVPLPYLALFTLCLAAFTSAAVLPELSAPSSCCLDNTISVTGQGKVSVQPDIALVSIGVSVVSKTSQQATQSVAQKIGQLTQILLSNKIKKQDIETQSLSIYPQYEYPDGKMELVGQNAQQTLTVTVRGIDKNGGNLGSIIDQLVKVNGIQFNGLTFDKEDKSEAQREARKLAFEDAKRKASEYAGLADRVLGKVSTISDNVQNQSGPFYQSADTFAAKRVGASTEVSVGQLDVSYSVEVKFSLR